MSETAKTGYPSIDKPWLKYYKHPVDINELPQESIFQRLERCNADRLDDVAIEMRVAQNGYAPGPQITFGTYFSLIRECARSLCVLGVKRDDVVVTILPNVPESRLLIYAANILGATVYPVSPMASTELLTSIIDANDVSIVAVFEPLLAKFAPALEGDSIKHVIHLAGSEFFEYALASTAVYEGCGHEDIERDLDWATFVCLKDEHPDDITPVYIDDHTAAIIGTSGTTGTSKGVCLTDGNLNALAASQELGEIFLPGELSLDALISSIGYGISMEHSSGCCGVHSVLIPELVTDKFAELLCAVEPDNFAGGPVHSINLYRSEQYRNGQIPKVRNLISGGASLDKELESKLNGSSEGNSEESCESVTVCQGYGATECCGSATYQIEGAYKFGGIGVPLPFEDMGIFEPGTDKELGYNEEGEICISGPTVMKGYLDNPDETANVLKRHSDGKVWLHLADLGHCDEDGQFYITDRIKNIFMRTGFNVHPSKIAEFISGNDAVAECCVVGIEHPDQQCVPVAFVVKDPTCGLSDDDAKEALEANCYANLAETDIPYEWVFVEGLPRNMGGKVDTQQLVALSGIDYLRGQER